jgi:hypothetical protein
MDLCCVFGGSRGFWFDDVSGELGASVWSKYVGDGLDGLFAVEWLMGKGHGGDGAVQCVNEGLGDFDGDFGGGWEGHVDFLREKFDSIGDSFGSCLVDVDMITLIVICSRS